MSWHPVGSDRALRRLPHWLLGGVVAAMVGTGIRTVYLTSHLGGKEGALGESAVGTTLLSLVLWGPAAIGLARAARAPRYAMLEMTLPIPSRALWLSRLWSLLLIGISILAVTAAVVAGLDRLFASLARVSVPLPILRLSPAFLACILWSAVLPHSVRPSARELPSRRILGLPSLVPAAAFPLLLALGRLPWPWAAAFAAAAILAAVRAYRRLPGALDLLPLPEGPIEAEIPPPSIEMARLPARGGWRGRARVWAVAWRCLQLRWKTWFAAPVFAFYGLLIGGITALDGRLPEERIFYLPMTWFLFVAFLLKPLKQLHFLDTLPVSRRAILALILLPWVISLTLGLGAGGLALRRAFPTIGPVIYAEGEEGFSLKLPLQFFEIAWNGRPPRITAPWGEAHAPLALPIVRGWGPVLYKPYTADQDASIEFVAWQLSRALEAVHGRALSPETIRREYLEEGPRGVVPRSPPLALPNPQSGMAPARRPDTSSMLALLILLPALLLCGLLFELRRPGVRRAVRQWGTASLYGLTLASAGAIIALALGGILDPARLAALFDILRRHALAAIPGGGWSAALIAASLAAALYLWVQGRFLSLESDPSRSVEIRD